MCQHTHPYECYYCSHSRKKEYGFWKFVLDLILIFLTCGLWALYKIFKALSRDN